MRNRWARWMVVGLILAFPLLMSAASATGRGQGQGGGFPRTLRASVPILAVEMVVVGGLVFASRERRRLLVELDAARSRPRSIAAPSAALTGLKMPTRRSVSGWVRR